MVELLFNMLFLKPQLLTTYSIAINNGGIELNLAVEALIAIVNILTSLQQVMCIEFKI